MNPATTTRMSAAQAAASGRDGYWVLNGDVDGPATTIVRDPSGADVRARTAEEAARALADAGLQLPTVELCEHEFPDLDGNGVHRMKVWVPRTLRA